eukprot:CAMPEP_0198730736 /NCGR_PEP_ID=MMETSP1475-20131203/25953_1 /TAXON_ID= ORGANISM="Unidentified sp., Strain CCMP1999" /NCGR_SAMPLE_ID=MMETSP1475 /ASSEMBLY_ACC=CAM_ASM_001111 /LENGTH=60 /DNA_ID=CAMNT_0044493589 /DNA_START=1451 /DNA_END=1633 /DNA_ORIENTATION=-
MDDQHLAPNSSNLIDVVEGICPVKACLAEDVVVGKGQKRRNEDQTAHVHLGCEVDAGSGA